MAMPVTLRRTRSTQLFTDPWPGCPARYPFPHQNLTTPQTPAFFIFKMIVFLGDFFGDVAE